MFKKKQILILVSLVVTSGAFWSLLQVYSLQKNDALRVDFLDVGQGDSILITAPNKTRMLIDTGPNQAVLSSLGSALPAHITHLDAVLLSHPDADHIGGTVDVFDMYDVSLLLVASSSKHNEIIDAIYSNPVSKRELSRDMRIVLDPVSNVYAEVLAPDLSWNTDDSNDLSLVLKLVYGETCFMFTGDASKKVEQILVHTYADTLDCDVLKVGHHGSNTSTSEAFIGYISPTHAIISAGKDNTFGHPHQEVLDVLAQFSSIIYRTDELGTISFVSDGKEVELEK